MSFRIRKAAVLGAGVMGSGIAAHLANAGVRTILLDVVPQGVGPEQSHEARSAFALKGIDNAMKFKPAPLFYDKGGVDFVEAGNFDDDMEKIADCDLVIEAIVENLEVKRQLFAKVAPHLKMDAILSSNTSGLSIAAMSEAVPFFIRDRFLVTHFFNPVRFMKLLELVPGPDTSAETMQIWADFGRKQLGKGVVFGKDTPNFIGNRIGIYAITKTIAAMIEDGFSIEEIDAIFGKPMGRPKTAAFKTVDLVGLDVFAHVANTCLEKLDNDPEKDAFKLPDFIHQMIAKGLLGAKKKAGFYTKGPKGERLVIDPKTIEYVPVNKPNLELISMVKGMSLSERMKTLVSADDRVGKLIWKLTAQTLIYAAKRIGDISDDVVNIDNAMKWGFNWEMGPFETWDAIGVEDSVKRMQAEGYEVPECVLKMLASGAKSFYGKQGISRTFFDMASGAYKVEELPPWQITIKGYKEQGQVLRRNMGAEIVDIGDGILCVEFHTKMNALDDDIMAMLNEACDLVEDGYEGLVVTNEADHFSAGANIAMVLMAAQTGNWGMLEQSIKTLQNCAMRLKYCDKPTVTAPFGMALGGGCEVSMHGAAMRPHAELYMGLVEVGVGVIPAGGGTKESIVRALEGIPGDNADLSRLPYLAKVFENIATAKVSMSAFDARRYNYVKKTDKITISRDALLNDAKQTALGMARAGYKKPAPPDWLVLPGRDGYALLEAGMQQFLAGGFMTPHDYTVCQKLAHVIVGGDIRPGTRVTEQYLLDLECEAFLWLMGTEKTQDRIQYMLANGKPLRN